MEKRRKPGNINARIRSELFFDVLLNGVSLSYVNLKHLCSQVIGLEPI
jgi:hypothetical protein